MSENRLEKSEMSTVEFASTSLKNRIAPRDCADTIQARIRIAARKLGWSFSRTKDVWYADPRVSISGEELREIEDEAGVNYGRAELKSVDDLIAAADEMLKDSDAQAFRPLIAAMRAMLGSLASPRP